MGFIIHFYIIFGTNLLTQRPSPDCCFLPISGFRRKGISNGVETEWNLRESYFWNDIFTRDLEYKSEKKRGAHKGAGHAQGVGAPPPWWAPRCSTDVLFPPIYTHIPWKHRGARRNPNSTAVTLCSREIPSWGQFRSSAGGGIDHGGLLHQHHSLPDESWVVYHRPLGP